MRNNQLSHKKFLFVTGGSGREQMMAAIATQLKNKFQVESKFIYLLKGKTSDYFIKQGFSKEDLYPIVYKENKKKVDIEYLRKQEIELGLNFFDIWQIAAPRKKKRIKMDYWRVLREMEFITRKTQQAFQIAQPDYVFFTGISSLAMVIAYKMAISKNIPVLELLNPRLPGRVTFDNKLTGIWPRLISEYQKTKQKPLNETQKELAQKLISDFKDKPFRPDDSAKVKESGSQKLKRYHQYAKTLMYRRHLPDLRPFFWYPFVDKIMIHLPRFQRPKKTEKFIFYPLQTHPEASTSVRAKWYVNQLALIENISKNIPVGYKLYVKEHRRNFSKRPYGFHKKITQFPNVHLISPKCNTIDLVKRCSLVITINSTVGWEAILLQKPVISFGEVFYNGFDQVSHITNMYKLNSEIRKKIDTTTDLNQTHQFIAAMFQSTYPGIAALPGDCKNRSLQQKNIERIVQAIENYVSTQPKKN